MSYKLELNFKKENYSNGFEEWLEYGGYKIKMDVPGSYDSSILYKAYYDKPFQCLESYKLKKLIEMIDKENEKREKVK